MSNHKVIKLLLVNRLQQISCQHEPHGNNKIYFFTFFNLLSAASANSEEKRHVGRIMEEDLQVCLWLNAPVVACRPAVDILLFADPSRPVRLRNELLVLVNRWSRSSSPWRTKPTNGEASASSHSKKRRLWRRSWRRSTTTSASAR